MSRVFPFLSWFKGYSSSYFRRDLTGGLTVALVLIPQSMAYAQLAGLPAYYGLYAALLPPIVASLFGSSRQLATGPVAIVSLMTATALEPLATAGSGNFIAYAVLLALMVGIFQFLLGVVRLGLVVNFLSHPVVSGFTNAGALIIASSQLSKLFGVYVEKGEHHYETVYGVIKEAISFTHWPTLALAVLAITTMIILRRINPRIPNVLIAVLITTVISWSIGFERTAEVAIGQIESDDVHTLINGFNKGVSGVDENTAERVSLRVQYDSLVEAYGDKNRNALSCMHQIELLNAELDELAYNVGQSRTSLRRYRLIGTDESPGQQHFYPYSESLADVDSDGHIWRLKIGNGQLNTDALTISSGGAVVGTIPQGLPKFGLPVIDFSIVFALLPMAMIISLLGFMEAISIAKAMAARTGQRLDVNQELIGQGLANIIGSFGQSYAVSGSFSRSAVNLQAGAMTGLSNAISSMVVVIVLLFFTPLLYHLPQAVLASIIIMAVIGLVSLKSFIHAWKTQWYDGLIGITTFICTLLFAPHLDRGIIIGVILSLLLYMIRNMKPVIALLSLHVDGTYRNQSRFDLGQCPHIAVIRYAGSLIFSNVNYLENQVLETVSRMPELRHVLIVGNGINELDASGADALSVLIDRLRGQGILFSVSGLNDSVTDVLRRTGLTAKIGENNLYHNVARSIENIWEKAHVDSKESTCPLRERPFKHWPISPEAQKSIQAQGDADPINKPRDSSGEE
ncbi:MAG: STAS domain-containing protein [FCB group bacterium]|nr:STAS domain-containing protein [FCB group bacterium]